MRKKYHDKNNGYTFILHEENLTYGFIYKNEIGFILDSFDINEYKFSQLNKKD